jgi:hypothetical protein
LSVASHRFGNSISTVGSVGASGWVALPWGMPNFVLLDTFQPEVAHLLTAMLQAREAVGRRSWSHPQEPTGEDWWADVLTDPRARKPNRRTDIAVRQFLSAL